MKFKYLLMAAMVLPCAMFTACDDGGGGNDIENPKCSLCDCGHDEGTCPSTCKCQTPIGQIDNSYNPTQASLQKAWAGEYTGWDAVQEANTTIRRKLVLNPNGNYTNVISGQLKKEGNNQFFKFESEAGTYTYNQSTRTITYTCRYDSVLNYRDQSYTVYNKKHYYSTEKSTYTEQADFTASTNGKRLWITLDTYLQSLTAEKLDIAFSMSEYAGDNQQDQNKDQK